MIIMLLKPNCIHVAKNFFTLGEAKHPPPWSHDGPVRLWLSELVSTVDEEWLQANHMTCRRMNNVGIVFQPYTASRSQKIIWESDRHTYRVQCSYIARARAHVLYIRVRTLTVLWRHLEWGFIISYHRFVYDFRKLTYNLRGEYGGGSSIHC